MLWLHLSTWFQQVGEDYAWLVLQAKDCLYLTPETIALSLPKRVAEIGKHSDWKRRRGSLILECGPSSLTTASYLPSLLCSSIPSPLALSFYECVNSPLELEKPCRAAAYSKVQGCKDLGPGWIGVHVYNQRKFANHCVENEERG